MPKEIKLYECTICGERYESQLDALKCEERKTPRAKFSTGSRVHFLHKRVTNPDKEPLVERMPVLIKSISRFKPSEIREMKERTPYHNLYRFPEIHAPIYTVFQEGDSKEIQCIQDELVEFMQQNN